MRVPFKHRLACICFLIASYHGFTQEASRSFDWGAVAGVQYIVHDGPTQTTIGTGVEGGFSLTRKFSDDVSLSTGMRLLYATGSPRYHNLVLRSKQFLRDTMDLRSGEVSFTGLWITVPLDLEIGILRNRMIGLHIGYKGHFKINRAIQREYQDIQYHRDGHEISRWAVVSDTPSIKAMTGSIEAGPYLNLGRMRIMPLLAIAPLRFSKEETERPLVFHRVIVSMQGVYKIGT